jgi:hypothetical protein
MCKKINMDGQTSSLVDKVYVNFVSLFHFLLPVRLDSKRNTHSYFWEAFERVEDNGVFLVGWLVGSLNWFAGNPVGVDS